jgi:hypothetical protein
MRNGMDAMQATSAEKRQLVVHGSAEGGIMVGVADHGAASRKTRRRTCSSPSSRPSRRAWAWGLTSAARSSNPTRADCGSSRQPGGGSIVPFHATRRMNSAYAHIVDDDEAIRDALTWLFKSRKVGARMLALGGSLPGRLARGPARLPGAGRAHGRHERPAAVRPALRARLAPAGDLPQRAWRHPAGRGRRQEGRLRFRREALQRQRAGRPRHPRHAIRRLTQGARPHAPPLPRA